MVENVNFFQKNTQLGDFSNCFVLINKEVGWTSFDVVAKLRSIFKTKKIGHAGTLDPLATGLLICAVGKYTKLIPLVQNLPKVYSATFRLGATTITDDAEGDEENITNIDHLTKQDIVNALSHCIGSIQQVPPQFSAVHINGKRSYAMARKGITVDIPSRNVIVNSIKLNNFSTLPFIEVTINCEKGTYIRSIARDVGSYLNVGGYMSKLQRVSIGSYNVIDSFTIGEIKQFMDGKVT